MGSSQIIFGQTNFFWSLTMVIKGWWLKIFNRLVQWQENSKFNLQYCDNRICFWSQCIMEARLLKLMWRVHFALGVMSASVFTRLSCLSRWTQENPWPDLNRPCYNWWLKIDFNLQSCNDWNFLVIIGLAHGVVIWKK